MRLTEVRVLSVLETLGITTYTLHKKCPYTEKWQQRPEIGNTNRFKEILGVEFTFHDFV